ncbi:hypothetical protein PR202_gb17911 [Eleusine coracana subsp. coracana]|uniref:Uncharacterized protein n=1 Tax=Eleusine coracana subsp. coracana TaxID=191504 RepID=A0AAV5F4T6_ELECO|nr:hypothetical protein PR202_gb17911 [Eleusine coracana subsp. coracana]
MAIIPPTKLGFGALTCNSGLAYAFSSIGTVFNSWGDAGSVLFVLAADAALLLLFLCLREFERVGRARGRNINTSWSQCGCSPRFSPGCSLQGWASDAARRGRGRLGDGGSHGCRRLLGTATAALDFDRHGLLTKLGLAALMCNSSLAIYRSRGDPGTGPANIKDVAMLSSTEVLMGKKGFKGSHNTPQTTLQRRLDCVAEGGAAFRGSRCRVRGAIAYRASAQIRRKL